MAVLCRIACAVLVCLSGAPAEGCALQSRKLGYRDDGIALHAVRGRAAVQQRLRLTRDDWLATRSVPVGIDGLARPSRGTPH